MSVQSNQVEKTVVLALTGASGMPYARRLLRCLLNAGVRVYLLYSQAAQIVAQQECAWHLFDDIALTNKNLCEELGVSCQQLVVVSRGDWFSCLASGSAFPDAMVVCPASMGCVAAIAHGLSDNLIERAADVCLKEKKPLLIVPRETPLSVIHLRNLTVLADAGASILPASPAFYHHPKNIDDMVDFVVSRILNHLHLAAPNAVRWGKTVD